METKEFMTVDAFAKAVGLGRDYCRKLARNGELPILHVGATKMVNYPLAVQVLRGKVEGVSAIGG